MTTNNLTPELFRQKLAGLQSNFESPTYSQESTIKDTAIRLCIAMAAVFSEDLDRITLWNRIGSALNTSLAKSEPNDCYQFFNNCLDHVKADHSQVASNVFCSRALGNLETIHKGKFDQQLLEYIRKYHFLIISHARQEWQLTKQERTNDTNN